MRKSVFTLEEHPKAYIGYASAQWKLWDMAHFELDVAKQIMEDFELPISYDEGNDQFKLWDEGFGDYIFVKGEDCHTEEGIKHLYGIGAGSWLWEGVNEGIRKHLAEAIEDFIWEYDTYAYWDCFGVEWNRESVVEGIKNQLRELTIFQQVYEIWHTEELSRDELFDGLRELMTV
jgi:hypothetical protein